MMRSREVPYESICEEFWTPEYARNMVQNHNPYNRVPKYIQIKEITDDMKKGEWFTSTGEFIKIDTNGDLRDGANRARAIMESGQPQWVGVIRGIDPEAIKYLDTGVKRSNADTLHMINPTLTNNSDHATAQKIIYGWDNRIITNAGEKSSRIKVRNNKAAELLNQYPDLASVVSWASGVRRLPISRSVLAATYYILNRVDESDACQFWHDIVNQSMNGLGDPRLAMLRACERIQDSTESEFQGAYLCVIFSAWNYWREGKTVDKIYHKSRSGFMDIPEPK